MRKKMRGQVLAIPPTENAANLQYIKQIDKVLEYFRYNVGTSLDCATATGVLRNNITWYIAELEELGLLCAICRKPDTTTGFMAKHYSADRTKWKEPPHWQQLSLFGKEGGAV